MVKFSNNSTSCSYFLYFLSSNLRPFEFYPTKTTLEKRRWAENSDCHKVPQYGDWVKDQNYLSLAQVQHHNYYTALTTAMNTFLFPHIHTPKFVWRTVELYRCTSVLYGYGYECYLLHLSLVHLGVQSKIYRDLQKRRGQQVAIMMR